MVATAKRKQVKKYKFELTRSAIGGIGVVCFCIFLWMFLLGVWTGQSLLMPTFLEPLAGTEQSHPVMDLKDQKKQRPQQKNEQ